MMETNLVNRLMQAVIRPEPLWEEEATKNRSWQEMLKFPVLPVIAGVAVLAALLTMVFGYRVPMIGVLRPSVTEMVMQMVGTIVMYTLSLLIFGWIAAWLAGMMGGKNDMNRGVAMLFWISVPSLIGQVLGTLPMVGWILGFGLGIYALVLLYKAIPVFMEVPVEARVKHFILLVIATLVISILLGGTLGRLFAPTSMYRQIPERLPMGKEMTKHLPDVAQESADKGEKKTPEKYIQEYVESMTKGDYGQDVVEKSAKDTFTPPADNLLTKAQVERFVALAKKVRQVQKEQAEAIKRKYEKKEKEVVSLSDIFSGLKDLSSMATLEMKVVKSNGGNWAEYQWVKDRVREAYYTPSLSEVTQHNAKLLEPYKEIIAEIL